jgi:hypothetical protein
MINSRAGLASSVSATCISLFLSYYCNGPPQVFPPRGHCSITFLCLSVRSASCFRLLVNAPAIGSPTGHVTFVYDTIPERFETHFYFAVSKIISNHARTSSAERSKTPRTSYSDKYTMVNNGRIIPERKLQ